MVAVIAGAVAAGEGWGGLVGQVPAGVFWAALIGWVLGAWSAWRFARLFEQMRDAVNHARHHYERAKDFLRFARTNVTHMVYAGAVFSAVVAGVGFLAWSRLNG